LWVEFEFQLARQILAHEFGIFADIGRDHLFHLPRLQQDAYSEIIHTRVVGCECQVLGARILDRRQQQFGNAAQAEPPAAMNMPSNKSPSNASCAEP